MKLSEAITTAAQPLPQQATQARNAAIVKGRYGEYAAFAAIFKPSRQAEVTRLGDTVTRNWQRYPSLVQCEHAYGADNMAVWLAAQLRHLFAKGEDAAEAMRTAVAILACPEFRPMKVTELMMFAAKFYAGGFGKVYGRATGTDIMEALRRYRQQLAAEKSAIERQAHRAELQQWAATAVSWEEYARSIGLPGKTIAEAIALAAKEE